MYSNLDLLSGTRSGVGNTSSFLEHRLLLNPEVVVDDRFSIRTSINLLQMGSSADSGNSVPENFGAPLDHRQSFGSGGGLTTSLQEAYLEWASDWGIFRFGRMPKSWGLGIVHFTGTDPLLDFHTVVDRVGYQALLGNLGLNIAYEKGAESTINSDWDDMDTFELSLDYSNPESLLDVGLLYTRNVRLAGAGSLLNSSHDLSIFGRKRMQRFQIGGEFATIGQDRRANQVGMLGELDWMPGDFSWGADLAYATSSSEGSFVFNPSYQPFLILFRQSVGTGVATNSVRGGAEGSSAFGGATNGSGGGGLLLKTRLAYAFYSKRYILGSDFGWAKLINQGAASSPTLGTEFDLHLTQKWYDNFKTFYALGMLFPSKAFGESPQVAWGLQIRGALTF